MRVTIENDGSDEFERRLRAAVARSLEEIGLAAEGYAKRRCPVDTGRLRGSITHEAEAIAHGGKVAVGADVEYAAYVELGTRRQKAQPYLRPAANDHKDEYREILKKNLKG